MEKGDLYIPVANSELPQLGNGIFQEELFIEREFGKYKIVRFLRVLNNVEFRDIFRVSDGPDLWLGCCSKEVAPIEFWDVNQTPLIFIEPGNRSQLGILADTSKFYHLEETPIEFLTEFFIEVSEKELEAHYNSLELV